MRSKMVALSCGAAVAAATLLAACTAATALRLPDDVYYYSGVTRRFGYTPSHHFYRWFQVPVYAGPVDYCTRRRSYDPFTGTYVDRHGIRRPCP
jgi:hypothetical protein